MAIVIESSYGKTIGLPGYSSHKFLVSVKSEVTDLGDVPAEARRIYQILQESVDSQITNPGYVPTAGGESTKAAAAATNGNGDGHGNGNGNGTHAAWKCSDKQRELIVRIIDENGLDRSEVNQLACDRFGASVPALNRLQASGLIDELLERYGGRPAPRQRGVPFRRGGVVAAGRGRS